MTLQCFYSKLYYQYDLLYEHTFYISSPTMDKMTSQLVNALQHNSSVLIQGTQIGKSYSF